MWRIWLMFDPRRAMIAMVVFLAVLAFTIHFIMLSTDRFNWIEGPRGAEVSSAPTTGLVAHEVSQNRLRTLTA